ncbi:type II toxin-antitoxin system HicB family antitoxin [Chloroflexota bacterium]
MLSEYIQTALDSAHYEIIEDENPYYGEVPPLAGVWASGKTLEACRRNLAGAIEDWVLFSIANGLPIPALGQVAIHLPERVPAWMLPLTPVSRRELIRRLTASHALAPIPRALQPAKGRTRGTTSTPL